MGAEPLIPWFDIDYCRAVQQVVGLDVAELTGKAGEPLPIAAVAAARLPGPRCDILAHEVDAIAKGIGRAGGDRREVERPASAA